MASNLNPGVPVRRTRWSRHNTAVSIPVPCHRARAPGRNSVRTRVSPRRPRTPGPGARTAGAEAVAIQGGAAPPGNVDPVAFPVPAACLLPTPPYRMDMVRHACNPDDFPDSATSRRAQAIGRRQRQPHRAFVVLQTLTPVQFDAPPNVALEHGPARLSSAMQQTRLPYLWRVCRWNIPDASVSKVVMMNATETRPDKRQVISRRTHYSTISQRQEPGANE